jgi:2'-5' RNA ligase
VRLFVALTPPADRVDELSAALDEVRGAFTGLRWTPPEHWHLTLAFLGEVDERVLPDLQVRLARSAARHEPLELRLAGAGRFGSRVLWIGMRGDTDGLRRLAGSVQAAARRARIQLDERPFRPHLTLARARGPAVDLRPLVERIRTFTGDPWTAADLRLMRSHLGAGAGGSARHEPVGSWPLGPADIPPDSGSGTGSVPVHVVPVQLEAQGGT